MTEPGLRPSASRITRLEVHRADRFHDYGRAGGPRYGGVVVAPGSLGSAGTTHLARQRDPERVTVPGLVLDRRLDVAGALPGRFPRRVGLGCGRSRRRVVRRRAGSHPTESARSPRNRAGARQCDRAAVATRSSCPAGRTKPALGTSPIRAAARVTSGCDAHLQPQLRRCRPPQPPRSVPAPRRRQRRASADPPTRRRLLARAGAQELLRAEAAIPARPPGLGVDQRDLPTPARRHLPRRARRCQESDRMGSRTGERARG